MRSLVAYLVGVIGTAIACGLLLNQLYASNGWPLQLSMAEHGDSVPLWRQLAAILLVALVLRVWIAPLWRRWVSVRDGDKTAVGSPVGQG